jgi:hypothetical protein
MPANQIYYFVTTKILSIFYGPEVSEYSRNILYSYLSNRNLTRRC